VSPLNIPPQRNARPSTDRVHKTHRGAIAAVLFLGAVLAAGCGPKYTYPASTVPQSVEKICQDEYKMTVQARVVGKTLGAVLYIDQLLDDKGQVSREVHEAMGKVMQATTRVSLSTDLPLDFCTVFVRDRKTGNELVITRSVDDSKRANADMIGIEESINRTLFGQGRYLNGMDEGFVLREIKIENFLADQIVQRIRFNFSKDAKEEFINAFALVDGVFDDQNGKRTFRFSVIGLKSADDPHATILNVFKVVNTVLGGYKYSAFDVIEIQDYLNRLKLVIDRQTMLDYQGKKIDETQILERFLTESQSIQEAFKLFGFALPQE